VPVGLAALLTPLRHTGPASVQDLGCALLRLVPAAVNEREAAEDLLESGPPPRDLLCDKGFTGRAFAAAQAARGTAVLVPPAKDQRASMPALLLKVIAQWRNRIEASFGEITEHMGLTRHGAHTFGGLLTRTGACSPGLQRPSPPTHCCASASAA